MKILFSPIGTADPLTVLGDGPMLHIVRHYRPQKIVLFLSPKMAEFEDADGRNRHAIELLAKELNIDTPEIIYKYSERTEVHRYDFYIDEFAQILTALDQTNPNCEIIVNVTSGTPAMQQALVAFDAFDRLGLRALQVATPSGDMNRPGDREDPSAYDLDTLWEINPDNKGVSFNRCLEVESAHFNELMLRDNIRALVENYDYAAAAYLAHQSRLLSSEVKDLIDGCVARLNLDGQKAVGCFSGTEFAYDPASRIPEYLWMLEVCLLRGQWADFLRAMTPALFEILLARVRKKLPDDDWMKKREKNGVIEYRVDSNKIHADPRLAEILPRIMPNSNPFVSNGNLFGLVEDFYPKAETEPLAKLRELEEKARHPLAHEIRRVDKEALEKAGGMKLEDALSALFKLCDEKPGLYQRINKKIVNLL